MSNSRAIAACTSTLRSLLQKRIAELDTDLSDLEVTCQPPDLARKGVTKAQLNVFLYETAINAAWRNMDPPRAVRAGERGAPPLPLNLRYLLTAYGRGESDNDATSHRVLGGALSVLHDRAFLQRSDLMNAMPESQLHAQFESVKVSVLPLSIEDMSKLWATFQTPYRLTAAIDVTVLLIESELPPPPPLPVLTIGVDGHGVHVIAGGLPRVTEVRMPDSRPAVQLGEDIVIHGDNLFVSGTRVRLQQSAADVAIEITPTAGDVPGTLRVHLPPRVEGDEVRHEWRPGLYALTVVHQSPHAPEVVSAPAWIPIAPDIRTPPPAPVNAGGIKSLLVTCEPRIAAGQALRMLLGDRILALLEDLTPPDPTSPSKLRFSLKDVPAGSYVARLRVDGVDSIPVKRAGDPPLPVFDPGQTVVVP